MTRVRCCQACEVSTALLRHFSAKETRAQQNILHTTLEPLALMARNSVPCRQEWEKTDPIFIGKAFLELYYGDS